MSDLWLLSLLWAIPLAGCLLVLVIPYLFPRPQAVQMTRAFALGVTLATFALSVVAFRQYVAVDPATQKSPSEVSLTERAAANRFTDEAEKRVTGYEATQADELLVDANGNSTAKNTHDLVVRRAWIPYFHIQYYLGLDGISLSLILLTGLVSVLACLASWNIEKQVTGYFSLFLLLMASMMGVFLALDLFLFYVFFEVMLLPMYFLIAVWGGENREYAAIKFLLYTLFGSVFILVAILILYFWPGPNEGMAVQLADGSPFAAHTFDALKLARGASETVYYSSLSTGNIQGIIFLLFFTGFCVKLPSVPFHTWLPDAHVQAPTPISMILAGVLLKIGGYGLVRLAWPLAPLGAAAWTGPVATLGVVSILYGALAAMAQTDFKKLVAYSSVSHMGYVTLGMAAMNLLRDPRYYAYGVNGAMYMMLAHGITSTGMFFLVGVIYERAHTRDLRKLGGLMNVMPVYGAISFLIFFGSMGLPGLCGFVAEVFVVLSSFNYNKTLAVLAAAALVLTAGYILWTLQRVFLGRNEQYRGLPDMNLRELIIAAPLVVLTVLMGVFPQSILSWMGPSVDAVVRTVAKANAPASPARAVAQNVAPPPVVRVR